MILKGSQRGGGQNLAAHLLNADDNEHVRVFDLRGFAADNLPGAFAEAEAISLGTKCRQYLFSLSLSPPEAASVSERDFETAIETIEQKLGLTGQPRAIVFHEKEGRRHAHCVWSRIDADTMTARPLPFFKTRLMEVARELYLDHGWELPRGFENAAERNPTNFSLAEWQQAKRQNIDPRWLKQAVQACWAASDTTRAFMHALEERGFFFAKGDKRGHVVMDHSGEVWSLPRLLNAKTREVRARLGDGAELPTADDTRAKIGQRMTPAISRHIEESRAAFLKRSATLGHAKREMTHRHRQARRDLDHHHANQREAELRLRTARLPKGLRGLWHRMTGHYQEVRAQNEREAELSRLRQSNERHGLIQSQLDERRILQAQFKALRHRQAGQLAELRRDIGKFLGFARGSPAPSPQRTRGLGLRLER